MNKCLLRTDLMISTMKNQNTGRKNMPQFTLCTSNPRLICLKMSPGLWCHSNYVTHTVSFDFIYIVFQHFFLYLTILCQNVVHAVFNKRKCGALYCRFRKNDILNGNSRYIKRASLFFNLSIQKSNRTHNPDLERNLLDTEKAGL